VLEADVELGGTDQLFNLLVGRALQKEAGQKEQIVMTSPLLVGLDGVQKMSKSLGNYIAFNDSAKDIFGKILSIPDEAMWAYYRLLLLESSENIEQLKASHPMEAKKQLAERLVARFFDKETAIAERSAFENVFSKKQLPEDMPCFKWAALAAGASEMPLIDLLAATSLFPSKKEIRRLIEQGAVRLNDEKVADGHVKLTLPTDGEYIFHAGKRTFFKITA
jgi:tyrosyl-tRNA synthetase